MGKIRRTVSAISDLDKDLRIDITVDIDVNAEGLFTTTLKGEDANAEANKDNNDGQEAK